MATFKKTYQFGFSLQQSPAALPMTPQNIQLLGSADGAGERQKRRIVAAQNEESGPMNELIFCPLPALSHLHSHNAALWCKLTNSKEEKKQNINTYFHKFIKPQSIKQVGDVSNHYCAGYYQT